MTVDTDERLSFPGMNSPDELRTQLQVDPTVLVWLVSDAEGFYAKERLIRVPTHRRWHGRTHEALMGTLAPEGKVLGGVYFTELPKSGERISDKLERDLKILQDETHQHPQDPRWWYYLGQTLEDRGEPREAVDAYHQCSILDGWIEQAAWACYKGAACLSSLGEFQKAIEFCAFGLSKQPHSPELAWLAGFCCYQLGQYSQAICWERMAITLGHFKGIHSGSVRTGFRHLPGWYEGPYDVLRFAYRSLGLHQAAEEAEEELQRARRERTSRKHHTTASREPRPWRFRS